MNRGSCGAQGRPPALKQAWEGRKPWSKAHLSHYGAKYSFTKRALGSGSREPGAATSLGKRLGSSCVLTSGRWLRAPSSIKTGMPLYARGGRHPPLSRGRTLRAFRLPAGGVCRSASGQQTGWATDAWCQEAGVCRQGPPREQQRAWPPPGVPDRPVAAGTVESAARGQQPTWEPLPEAADGLPGWGVAPELGTGVGASGGHGQPWLQTLPEDERR